MLLYTNRTQSPAIVTIKLENVEDADAAVMLGTEVVHQAIRGAMHPID